MPEGNDRKKVPLIYSCSGCSSAAQLANHLAVRIDRQGTAEMSCIAGVGGDVPALVRVATAKRPIVVIDGCPLQCARHCLKRHGVTPDLQFTLSEHDVRKTYHQDFSDDDARRLLAEFSEAISKMNAKSRGDPPDDGK